MVYSIKKIISNRDNCEGPWTYINDFDRAFRNAYAIIIIEWSEYLNKNGSKMSKDMRQPFWVFDARGMIEDSDLFGTNINFWKFGKGFLESS